MEEEKSKNLFAKPSYLECFEPGTPICGHNCRFWNLKKENINPTSPVGHKDLDTFFVISPEICSVQNISISAKNAHRCF